MQLGAQAILFAILSNLNERIEDTWQEIDLLPRQMGDADIRIADEMTTSIFKLEKRKEKYEDDTVLRLSSNSQDSHHEDLSPSE